MKQTRARHEVRAERHHAPLVQVPDGQQGPGGVAPLGDLLLREEADVAGVPYLQGGEVGFLFGTVVRLGRVSVGYRARTRIDALLLLRLVLLCFDRSQANRDHGPVVGPGRGAVADDFKRIGDPRGVRVEGSGFHPPVQVAPGEYVVRDTVGRRVLS